MGCVDQKSSKDLTADMSWYISTNSGMIQLNPVLPLDIVYQTEHNPGTTGAGWLDHHNALAKFISKYDPKNVFEIGGSHGILSECYRKIDSSTSWTIIEPNPIPVEGLTATVIKGFYNENTVVPNNTDMLVHSHVLEHFYNPAKFFEAASLMPRGSHMCFSVPALRKHLGQQFTNTLNFEHTYLCTEEFIEWWLECYGFNVVETVYYQEDHSIFYAAVRADRAVKMQDYPNSYRDNLTMFEEYLHYHQKLVADMNRKIAQAPGPVYLFGAHVFSQFLLSFGLDNTRIESILDNSKAKQGKRLYGTNLKVFSPGILKNVDTPTIILRTGVFDAEIKKDILENINPNAIFLE
jgi:hypothetical protein